MVVLMALLALLAGAPLLGQCTGISTPANFGGLSGSSVASADPFIEFPETFIAGSRPATARLAVSEVDLRMLTTSATPFTVRFVAFRPSEANYIARNVSAVLSLSATPPGQVVAATINPPLQFEPGDVLGVTFYSASGGGPTVVNTPARSGFLIFHGDAPAGTQFGRDSATRYVSSFVLAVEAVSNAPCEQLPYPEILVPVVGDVVGAAHFVTDLVAQFAPSQFGGPVTLHLTLHDRMGGSPRIATATVNGAVGAAYHPASLATALNVTPPYFGPLTIAFLDGPGFLTNAVYASARITAPGTCGGGETGSAVDGVGCDRIGREIAIPFHVPAGHRLNVGIASAEMNSCGIFVPATSAEVWVNGGPHVIVPMPGESTQINDITGAGASPYRSAGVTDGIVVVRVTDEATRIVAYSSLADNASQDSAIALGSVLQ